MGRDGWHYGCGDLTGYSGDITLLVQATRGTGPLGDIGIDDVALIRSCSRKLDVIYIKTYTYNISYICQSLLLH